MSSVMNERDAARQALLEKAGWSDASVIPLTADASTRRYFRLGRGDETALLMDAPPGAEAACCPPDADEAARRALGYNAMARLAGPRLNAFTGIAKLLRQHDVRAPNVLADDPVNGFALLEDFGDLLLAKAAVVPEDEARHYAGAMDVLRAVRKISVPDAAGDWPLLTYDNLVLLTEAGLLTEWFAPHIGVSLSDRALEDWNSAWLETLSQLSPPTTLVLRDYHAENILVADDDGLAIIDFQDALVGHAAYDAVSLLEDARRDVAPGVIDALYQTDRASVPDPAQYDIDYAVLAAQRNAKILGIFARLINRDGKAKYASFLPRVLKLYQIDLIRPPVAPIRRWTEQYMPDLLKVIS
ncbi:aminoglycoside phosphotransferase family protein [Parvularcula sp. LCG005]|uniref:aminoglycoside phosphotransferase family protein n=1 Tax=Parvularcula sp. LCG005 TaxID=3078805 RepID=UPI0029422CD2|nr:phosphotransferase [Parvularcula sp. LCG005]WOI53497.1 phosphotransferase [Parvularcula sp. LCG005]